MFFVKKIQCAIRFPVVLLLLLCFVGCGEVVPSSDDTGVDTSAGVSSSVTDFASTDGKVDASSDFFDKADYSSSPLPDEVILKTDTYTIERIDGFCYLTFAEGCEPKKWVQAGCVVETGDLHFSTLREMFQAFTAGPMDGYALQMIRTFNPCTEDGKYLVPDPYYFKMPDLPKGYLPAGLRVNGLRSTFNIKNSYASGSFGFLSEAQYQRYVAEFGTFAESYAKLYRDTVTQKDADERGGTVYEVRNDYYTYRYHLYTVSKGSVEYYIKEQYVLWEKKNIYGTSETVPYSVTGYGVSGGEYFTFTVRKLKERPSEEWLSSFGVTLYDPPAAKK